MEHFNYEYLFQNLAKGNLPDVEEGTFLWIWKPLEAAPHIGLSLSGKYFSLKVSGKEESIEAKKMYLLAQKKSTPVAFLEILSDISLVKVNEAFANFERAKDLKSSCLQPIAYLFKTPSVKLAELLMSLELRGALSKTFTMNCSDNTLGIIPYDVGEIEKKLISLQHVKRK